MIRNQQKVFGGEFDVKFNLPVGLESELLKVFWHFDVYLPIIGGDGIYLDHCNIGERILKVAKQRNSLFFWSQSLPEELLVELTRKWGKGPQGPETNSLGPDSLRTWRLYDELLKLNADEDFYWITWQRGKGNNVVNKDVTDGSTSSSYSNSSDPVPPTLQRLLRRRKLGSKIGRWHESNIIPSKMVNTPTAPTTLSLIVSPKVLVFYEFSGGKIMTNSNTDDKLRLLYAWKKK